METKWFVIIGLVVTGALYGFNQSTHSGGSGGKPVSVQESPRAAPVKADEIYLLNAVGTVATQKVNTVFISNMESAIVCRGYESSGISIRTKAPIPAGYIVESRCSNKAVIQAVLKMYRCTPDQTQRERFGLDDLYDGYRCRGEPAWYERFLPSNEQGGDIDKDHNGLVHAPSPSRKAVADDIYAITYVNRSTNEKTEGMMLRRAGSLEACKLSLQADAMAGAYQPRQIPIGYSASSACITETDAQAAVELHRCTLLATQDDTLTDLMFPTYAYQCKGEAAWWDVFGRF